MVLIGGEGEGTGRGREIGERGGRQGCNQKSALEVDQKGGGGGGEGTGREGDTGEGGGRQGCNKKSALEVDQKGISDHILFIQRKTAVLGLVVVWLLLLMRVYVSTTGQGGGSVPCHRKMTIVGSEMQRCPSIVVRSVDVHIAGTDQILDLLIYMGE